MTDEDKQEKPEAEKAEQISEIAETSQTEAIELAEPKKPAKRGGRREGAGRKKLTVTDDNRRQVREMAEVGLTQEQIAKVMGFSVASLQRYYDEELSTARAIVVRKVGQSLIRDALDGDKTSQIFYLKCNGGWRESNRMEVSGPDGSPLQFTAVRWTIVDPPKKD